MNIFRHFGALLLLAMVFMAMPKAHASTYPNARAAQGAAIMSAWRAQQAGRSTTVGSGESIAGGLTSTPLARAADGGVTVGAAGTITAGGVAVPGVVFKGDIAKEAIAGALSGCLGGGLPGCVIGVATPFALQWMATAGVRKNPDTGQPERSDPTACLIGPCTGWQIPDPYNSGVTYRSKSSVMDAYKAAYNAANSYYQITQCGDAGGNAFWCDRTQGGGRFYVDAAPVSRPPDSATWMPSTPQEVKDALYNHNPPLEIVDELAKHGNIVWTLGDPTRLTGPAEVTGPKTTTQHPDGSTTERQTKTPMTYDGPKITAGTPTTTTTNRDPQGNPTGTTTETTEPGTEGESQEEGTPTDTPMPPVPDFYTPKFPDGIVGVWNARKAELMAAPLVQLKDTLLPTVGSSGSCPTMPINMDFASYANFGTHDVAPPCWVWDFGKVVVILSAMFLARALIFGG